MDNDVNFRVIQTINNAFYDGESLKKIDTYRKDLLEKQSCLEKRLDHTNSSISHELQDLLNSGDELDQRVGQISDQNQSIIDKARDCVEECGNFQHDNKQILNDISIVRGVTQYTLWLRLLDQISLDISVSLETQDKEQIINSYKRISEVATSLKDSKCKNLCDYVESTRQHWYNILTEKYITKLQEALKVFNCPFIESLDNKATTAIELMRIGRDEVKNLQDAVEILLCIENPPSNKSDLHTHLWLPIKVLMKPLRKRFKFHFLGTKTTNNPMKPEWFISQLSSWALAHRQFLNEYIQPAYDRVGIQDLAVLDFAKGLVLMAIEKLEVDVPLVLDDDVLFAHTIDEVIGFSGDLAKTMQYSSTEPSILQPLTENNVFNRWLSMERKFAFEKVDSLFMETGSSVWESEVGGSFTPRAGEIFLALLLSVTERYKLLSSSSHRIQFLHLQTDLIEDFRVRLVQIVRHEKESPLSSNLCPILNTLDHLMLVLANWAENSFFLKLALDQCTAAANTPEQVNTSTTTSFEIDDNIDVNLEEHINVKDDTEKIEDEIVPDLDRTVFQTEIEGLRYLKEQLINEVVECIYYTVTARSVKYRSETKWFLEDQSVDGVSPSACEMLQSLAFGLDSARKRINPESFQDVWRILANKIHSFILEEVILHNKFSLAGGKQLECDVITGFFPIFGEFTNSPKSYFHHLMDVLILLTAPVSLVGLTLAGLQDTCDQGAANILAELGIKTLTKDRAIKVLQCRMDRPPEYI